MASMQQEGVLRQVQQAAGCASPSARRRAELQQQGNGLLAARQRPVLPEGTTCGLWSFTIPWTPFAHYLQTLAPDAKPFLWTQPFRLGGGGEFMAFFGAERMEAESGRLCLWMGICNNLSQPTTVYSKLEIWMPGTFDTSPCGDSWPVGDAVDTLSPCGQQQGQSFGRFWWHVSPDDVSPHLFQGPGDKDDERSFEVLLTLKINPHNPQTRSPARDDDPQLWELSKRYLKPWVETATTARVTAQVTPLQSRIAALAEEADGLRRQKLEELELAAAREEQRVNQIETEYNGRLQEAEARRQQEVANLTRQVQQLQAEVRKEQELRFAVEQAREQERAEAQRREKALQDQLHEAARREEALQKQNMQLRQQLQEAQQREAQLRHRCGVLEQQLGAAAQREEALRKRQDALEGMLRDAAAREDQLRDQLQKIQEYIKGTQQREERYRADIAALEQRAKEGHHERSALQTRLSVMESNLHQAGEMDAMLRESNTRLLAAAVEEVGRTQAISNSPQRQRQVARGPGR